MTRFPGPGPRDEKPSPEPPSPRERKGDAGAEPGGARRADRRAASGCLWDACEALLSSVSEPEALERALDQLLKAFDCDGVALHARSADGTFQPWCARGHWERTPGDLREAMGVPLFRGRERVGALDLLAKRGQHWRPEQLSLVRTASGALGAALGARLELEDLRRQPGRDPVTGLADARSFHQRLVEEVGRAERSGLPLAVVTLDLDHFAGLNERYGRACGDDVLAECALVLRLALREGDLVARLGGDEFGLLLESCSLDEAMRSAEQLREAVRNFRFVWEERTFRLGASIGVVPISPDNEDVASVLSAADSACAAAKEAGRNRVHSFEENDIDLMRRRREMQWAARINNALEESRFELFRQTIQPLQRQDPGYHYELLLRMRDENGKIISPDNFIAAAERYGITPNIDRWVIENAFRWLVSEADEREKLSMCSINLSGQSLGDDKFLPFVIDQFHRSGLDATKICFEITETAAVASFSQANRFIQSLKDLGCKFALDDFGTGLSSFGYLKHFPVDFLKIDGSFVKEILHDPIDREMVRSINEIGHLTGKQTIAEFAENQEIIQMLRGLGVDYAQGYGVSQPQRVLKAATG